MKKFTLALSLIVMLMFLGFTGTSVAQSTTSGDIAGVVSDSTGAVIPGAKITVTNIGTGQAKTTASSSAGDYRVSLLSPGNYTISVASPGFSTSSGTITVSAGEIASDNVKLSVGQAGTVVEVTAQSLMVNTENADVSTTFTAEQVQALPNPGNDLTFVAQTAPGTVMNTGTAAGGYGNFSSFGISGLSNMFTLDGGYENDPFLNLNNTGASNLTLGNNEVDTVTVISPAYSSQFGGLGGAQVNEITSSGTNRIHGNASYYWDGRALNSNDFFNKQNEAFYGLQNIPTFVNANQWAASVGGPIIKDKLFWFVNTEGIRAITPQNSDISVPNSYAQACSLGTDTANYGTRTVVGSGALLTAEGVPNTGDQTEAQLYNTLTGGVYTPGVNVCGALNYAADQGAANSFNGTNVAATGDPVSTGNGAFVGLLGEGGIPFAPAAAIDRATMQTVFGVYNNSPLRASTAIQNPNDPATNIYYAKNAALLTEWLLTARLDYKIGDKDNFYIHYKQDHGIQPTYTDLVDPRFTASSVQPAWEGQISETHTFTPNLVNQLVLTGNYYSAPFENTNNYVPLAPFGTFIPITGTLGYYGGEDYAFPQGRNVSGYQVIDDVSYTKGRNTVRFGYNIRRDNITDIQGEETVAPAAEGTEEGFLGGTVDYEFLERYPVRPTQPVSVYDMGSYVEDSYKLTPTFTMTAGLRLERNSNPICHTDCFSVFNGPISSLPTGAASKTAPYNGAFTGGLVKGNRYRAFTGYQKVAFMPRIAANWQATSKTTIRLGFGMFTDSFPGVIADDALSNVPTQFKAAAYGYVSGRSGNAYDINPAAPGSGETISADSALRFRQGFANGTGTYTSVSTQVLADTGSPYATPSFTTTAPNIKYPTYEEFSFAIEQRIDSKTTVTAMYVGNHGYHEPVANGGFNLSSSHASSTYFSALPTASPVTAFATMTNVYSGASSNYNGVVASVTRRSKALTLQFNYEFSKALDEVSNGGLEPFAPDAGDSGALVNPYNLASNYGPADYNVKHNITSSFVYELPSFVKSSYLMRQITGGFEFSGDAFHQSGLPYSITQSASAGGAGIPYSIAGGSVELLAKQLNNNFDHHCGGGQHVVLPNGVLPNACNFVSSFANPTAFAQQSRNSLVGPSYTNVNFGAFKTITIPHYEFMKLKLGAQMFNAFNHTNFQNPGHARGSDNTDLGGLSLTVGAPTSILGSTGGADASPRLIQLHAALTF